MKTLYVTGTAILGAFLIISLRSQPARIDASVDANSAPMNTGLPKGKASRSRFVQKPVSDQARSLVRFAREQICLTPQHSQSMDGLPRATQALLSSRYDLVALRQSALGQKRDSFPAASAMPLDRNVRIYLLEERPKLVTKGPPTDPELTAQLKAELAREFERLSTVREGFAKVDDQLPIAIFPVFIASEQGHPDEERLLRLDRNATNRELVEATEKKFIFGDEP